MATPTKQARRGGGTTNQKENTDQADIQQTGTDQTGAEAVPAPVHRSAIESSESTAGRPRAAADKATRRNSTEVTVPFLGTVKLPAADELAFLGGVGVLAVVGAIEWPVAVVLGAGHALAANHRNKVLREFGEALERV
jgi:hypothetical protein